MMGMEMGGEEQAEESVLIILITWALCSGQRHCVVLWWEVRYFITTCKYVTNIQSNQI